MPFRRTHRGFSRAQRLHYLLWTLFVLVTGATQEGFGLRPCCMQPDMASGMPMGGMHDMGGTHGMGGMHHAAAPHGSHRTPADAPGHSRCTCLGTCQAGGSNIALPGEIALVQGTSAGRWIDAVAPRHEWLHSPLPFFIPFPHAPPHLG